MVFMYVRLRFTLCCNFALKDLKSTGACFSDNKVLTVCAVPGHVSDLVVLESSAPPLIHIASIEIHR